MSWFYRNIVQSNIGASEANFLNYLRKKLPVIPGGGGGAVTSLTVVGTSGAATLISGVLNIPTPAAPTFVSLTTNNTSGAATLIGGVLNIPQYTGGVSSVFTRTGAVVATSGDYNTSQVTEVTNLYFTNARAIAAPITGYVSGAGAVAATDTILQAINKLNGNAALLSPIASPTFTGIVTTPNLTLSTFTAGSILFAGISGAVSQDNTSLFFDDTNNRLGLLTAAPTHSLTLGSTATGYTAYNTSDQTTNFERATLGWASNEFQILSAKGGTGTQRTLAVGCTASTSIIRFISTGQITVGLGTGISATAGALQIGAGLTITGSTAIVAIHTAFFGTIGQSSTAGYRMLMISPFENTTGSGIKYLIDAGTNTNNLGNGTHTTKFNVDSSGNTSQTGNFTLATAGSSFNITEGTNARVGQTTLVAGTKAITITGLTTSSRAYVQLASQGGTVSTTVAYEAVCTSNTLTINAVTSAGSNALNALDTSILNYFTIN